MSDEASLLARAAEIQNALKSASSNDPLTADERRVLEYFWNEDQHSQRTSVLMSVVHHLETSRLTSDETSKGAEALVKAWTDMLVKKGYLVTNTQLQMSAQVRNSTTLKLTPLGGAAVARTSFWKSPIQWVLKHKTLLQGVAWGAAVVSAIAAIARLVLG